MLPGVSQEAVLGTLTQVLADPPVVIQPLGPMDGTPVSPLTPEIFQMVERLVERMYPAFPWSR